MQAGTIYQPTGDITQHFESKLKSFSKNQVIAYSAF
jgi:hypothetical protein